MSSHNLLFDFEDLLADIDGFNGADEAKRLHLSIFEMFPAYYIQGDVNTRFTDIYNRRFNSNPGI